MLDSSSAGAIVRAMKTLLWLAAPAIASLLPCSAHAAFMTGFEPPVYVSGTINGQDSWTVSANDATSRVLTAAEIETELTSAGLTPGVTVHGGAQALLVSGTGASNATIRGVTGLELETRVLLDVFARPLAIGNLGNTFLTMEDSAGTRAAAFRFGPSNSIDYGTNVAGTWQASGFFWNTDTWYRLSMDVDYFNRTYDFSIDGIKVNTDPIPFYNNLSPANFAQLRIFRGSGQGGAIFDDLMVDAVPEPAAAILILAGGLALCSRRRTSMRIAARP